MDSKLLNDRIGKLKEWEQKESINEILFNALTSLSAYTDDRFDELTKEIRDEAALNNNAPIIKIAVCTEENIDNQVFFHTVSTEPPLNSPGYITTVFAECDYPTMQKLIKQTYPATIKSKTETQKIQVSLRYSMKYLQKLQSLYYVMSENELPWTTVNAGYFYKFLDVYSEFEIDQEIEEFEIDFTTYEKYMSYDKVLLWNITRVTAPVVACEPKPAFNAVLYEHVLKKLELETYQYLVCPLGDKFSSFTRGRDMYIRTYAKQLEQIELLRIICNEDAESPLYLPPKSNKKKPGLVNALAQGRYIPTRGEAERIIESLFGGAELRLRDMKVLPYTIENAARYKGVDYNFFMEANSFLPERKLLLFSFNINAAKMWAHEIMFYALSELQLYFYEYRCVGEMV